MALKRRLFVKLLPAFLARSSTSFMAAIAAAVCTLVLFSTALRRQHHGTPPPGFYLHVRTTVWLLTVVAAERGARTWASIGVGRGQRLAQQPGAPSLLHCVQCPWA